MCYEITISLISSLILYHCHKVKHIFYMIPIFTVMKNNLSFGFYSTCTLVFWLPTLDLFDKFHSLLSLNWKLTRHSPVQELICKNEFLLLLSHEIAFNAYVG